MDLPYFAWSCQLESDQLSACHSRSVRRMEIATSTPSPAARSQRRAISRERSRRRRAGQLTSTHSLQPFLVFGRRYLRGLDLAAAPPEDVGVRDRHADAGKMVVDRLLVREHGNLVGAMRNGHDVDVREFGTAFAPVAVGENVMAAHFAPGLDLPTLGHAPVKECVIARHARAARRGLHVLEESRKSTDHFPIAEVIRDAHEFLERFTGLARAEPPEIGTNFVFAQLTLQRLEHAPLATRELDDVRVDHASEVVALRSGLHALAPDMTDAEGEELFCRHRAVRVGADAPREEVAVRGEGESLRYFERRPEAVRGAWRRGVGRANDDVSRERILTPEKIECRIELLARDAPCHERSRREIRRHERLSNAPNGAGGKHRAQTFEDGFERETGKTRDLAEWIDEKAGDAVLGDGEDSRVDRIADLGGDARRGPRRIDGGHA